MQDHIYHLVDTDYLEAFQKEGQEVYYPITFEEEKFIHCCTAKQIPKIVERYFSQVKRISILKLEVKMIRDKVLYEDGADGDAYPHIYGGIYPEAILETRSIR